jgi:hypothetical protein
MEHLVGSSEWDSYLLKLEPMYHEAVSAANTWRDKMVGGWKEEDRVFSQMMYHKCQARADTLQECMALPRQILEESKRAPTPTAA